MGQVTPRRNFKNNMFSDVNTVQYKSMARAGSLRNCHEDASVSMPVSDWKGQVPCGKTRVAAEWFKQSVLDDVLSPPMIVTHIVLVTRPTPLSHTQPAN
jgi:hypothetical protein